jgi:hypothetical protein
LGCSRRIRSVQYIKYFSRFTNIKFRSCYIYINGKKTNAAALFTTVTTTTIPTLQFTKQDNLTFSNPLLNIGNAITLITYSTVTLDILGNLSVVVSNLININASNISSGTQWITNISNNIYYNSGSIGIGTSTPGIYKLNVSGKINCSEICRKYLNSFYFIFNFTSDRWDFISCTNRKNNVRF